tara:strand:+ start:314 stop:502 length:189 start_codon:yes stop_codon:yes gene_type:complete
MGALSLLMRAARTASNCACSSSLKTLVGRPRRPQSSHNSTALLFFFPQMVPAGGKKYKKQTQ